MKKSIIMILLLSLGVHRQFSVAQVSRPAVQDSIPALLAGNFLDDYGIAYTITQAVWHQRPNARYHIIKWNVKEQYIIAKNDEHNHGDGGLYTRIDYMQFSNMEPWRWGYCLSVYNAKTDAIAEATAKADRQNPRKGCNGYPFSRMKKVE